MAQGRYVHSVEKAVVLLDCLWKAGGSLSLTELVQQTGWAKSTVHGLLASMLDSAVVEQDRTDGRYRLGYHLFELGQSVSAGWNVVELVRPRLEQVVQELGESACLARLSGDELLIVDSAEPTGSIRVTSDPGIRLPIHCTSQGKSILSAMPEEEAKALLERRGMPALTPATITTWEGMRSQLELTRELGYSVERGEYRVGLQSVGAPIYSADGSCSYAIGVIEFLRTGQPGTDRKTIETVRAAAAAASYDLGWRGTY